MVTLSDIYPSLLPYLTVQESKSLAIALPSVSKSYRSIVLLHNWNNLYKVSSEKWHKTIE